MKRWFLAILALGLLNSVFAQTDEKREAFRSALYADAGSEFAMKAVPEVYQDKDAVILAKKISYAYGKGKAYHSRMHYEKHYRIKVLNRDGVKILSELEFEVPQYRRVNVLNNYETQLFFGVQIEKEKGERVQLSEKDLVEVDNGNSRTKNYKIAIGSLEAGDIIDYYLSYQYDNEFYDYYNFYSGVIDYFLQDGFPVVHQELLINLEKKFELTHNAYNGAPLLQLKSEDKESRTYQLQAAMQDTYRDERWTMDYVNLPFVKAAVYYSKKPKKFMNKWYHVFGNQNIMSSEVALGIANEEVYDASSTTLAHMKVHRFRHVPKKASAFEIAKAGYNYFRHREVTAAYAYELIEDHKPWDRVRSAYFNRVMANYFWKYDISFEAIVTTARHSGVSIDDVRFLNEPVTLLAIKGEDGKRIFMYTPDKYTQLGDIPYTLEGMPAYAIDMSVAKKRRTAQKITIQGSTAAENTEHTLAKIQLNLSAKPGLLIDRTIQATGQRKYQIIEDQFYGFDYLDYASGREGFDIDLVAFGEENNLAFSRRERKMLDEKKASVRKEMNDSFQERFEKQLKDEFDIDEVTLTEHKITQGGIWYDEPVLSIDDKFEAQGLVKRVGPNYLLEIGKLIGGQVAVQEKEMKRKSDIQYPFARTFTYEMQIEVPSGYTVEGLDKLNYKVQNSAGEFSSNASLKDNVLIVSTKKVYAHAGEKKEAWPDIVKYLDAAYQFSQQKILIKKGKRS